MQFRFLSVLLVVPFLSACLDSDLPTSANKAGLRPYDPDRIIYDPTPTRFPECGDFSIGLDPRWELDRKEVQDGRDGIPRVTYESRFSDAVSERLNPNPVAPLAVSPSVWIRVHCELTPTPPGTAKEVADRFFRNYRELDTTSDVLRGEEDTRAASWESVRSKVKQGSTYLTSRRMYAEFDGRLVTVDLGGVVITGKAVGIIPRGEVFRGRLEDGTEVAAVMVETVTVIDGGAIIGFRRASGLQAFFNRVQDTIGK